MRLTGIMEMYCPKRDCSWQKWTADLEYLRRNGLREFRTHLLMWHPEEMARTHRITPLWKPR